MPSSIPIENIYYLYCYAWDRFHEGQAISAGAEKCPDLPNLLTRVLLNGMQALVRRGLDRTYQPVAEDLATVRGHIDLGPSLGLQARNIRQLHCQYDELSYDVLHNQILQAALKRIAASPALKPDMALEAHRMLRRLPEISDIRLTASCFKRVQLHRNNAYYDLLLHIARLIFENTIPAEGGEGYRFKDPLQNEQEMARIFEAFVRNFYRIEQRSYRVEPLAIRWDAIAVSTSIADRLPQMRVDVFLRSSERQIIIDTKYYIEALQSYRGSPSFRSAHLYQLFSYLKNYAPMLSDGARLDGMLLYPQVGDPIDATYEIQGHEVRIATVDLAKPWSNISSRLLALV